jgi:hypothetical protein
MSTHQNSSRAPAKDKTVKRIKPSIKKETILASDYNHYILPFSCEECSHFSSENIACTLGLNPIHHLEITQKKSYHLSGTMALCRFQEID